MPGTTPVYGLHYPVPGDTLEAAVRSIPQQLAADVESTVAALTGTPAPGAWTALPLVNSWAPSTHGARYRKVAGVVYVTAHVAKASWAAGEKWAELPPGFRPSVTIVAPAFSGHVITVAADGSLYVPSAPSGGGFWTSFPFPI